MKTCKNCINFKNIESWMDEHLGFCVSEYFNVNPNYYTDSERKTESNMIEVTYQPIVGENFGCIHFKKKGEKNV